MEYSYDRRIARSSLPWDKRENTLYEFLFIPALDDVMEEGKRYSAKELRQAIEGHSDCGKFREQYQKFLAYTTDDPASPVRRVGYGYLRR